MSLKQYELFRLMPSSKISVNTVSSGGGSLVTGSYQFAYRLIDDYSGRSTKFSLFTHPVMISSSDSSGDKSGPVSSITDKSIEISFNATNEEVSLYNTYQIAVIESNSATGQSTAVSLSDQIALTPSSNSYKYDSNESFDRIGIEEVSVDDAAIKTFKTIVFKNNRLAGGNVRYKDLILDNGNPIVASGEIIERKIPVSGNTDKAVSESKGYFSDEVYRFYVSFWDEYGDFSLPYPLNMNSVIGNTATAFGGFKDMKFPKRSVNNPIIETVNDGENDEYNLTINRGVKLEIANIPSWAKGLVVLRAKRKKGIVFQSPLVPTTIVQSPDAQNEYPGEGAGAPNPLGTILPKNMAFALNKAIVRKQGVDFSHVDWSANYEDFDFCKKIHVAFPPEAMFNNSGVPYLDFVKNEKINLESVDYCFLSQGKSYLLSRNKSLDTNDIEFSNDGSRSTSNIMVAAKAGDYASCRLDESQYKAEIESTNRSVTDEVSSISIVPSDVSSLPVVGLNEQSPTSDFGNHADLKITPDGPYNGTTPSNQKCFVVTTKGEREDISYYGVNGVKSGYDTSNILKARRFDGQPISIDPSTIRDVTGEFSNPPYQANNSFLEIVNFKNSLGDDRYGDPFSKNEIVSTGSIHTFEVAPSSVIAEVFGGDCFISPFTFKIQDSHYAVVNSALWGDDGKGFGKSFKDSSDKEIRRPFPYSSQGFTIGLYLESEVNSLYSEEFLPKGREGIYNQIVPSVGSWAGNSQKGSFYSYSGRIYRGLVDDNSGLAPDESVGYIYEDLGKSLNGSYYPIKLPMDLFHYPKSFNENKIPLNYLYNPEYSIQDQSKPFPLIYSKDKINRVNFSSRIVYSDPGILQTNIEGLNRFRVGNTYDIEESRGSITKLINHQGNLYGIQTGAFCYIPFETNILETADGVALSVQSAQIVGNPQYIERHGTRFMRSVVSTPKGLMFGDFDNSKIIMFTDRVSYLNDLGVSSYIKSVSESLRGQETSDSDAQFYYDYSVDDIYFKIKNEALVLGPTNSVKTILRVGSDLGDPVWDFGMYFDSRHFIIGKGNELNADYMISAINENDGNNSMLARPFQSRISFVVNDEDYHTKMFYLVKFLAQKQEDVSISTYSNNRLSGSYDATTSEDRWAGYLLNFIRNKGDKKRLRGEYAIVSSSVGANEITAALTKVQSAYRII